jgi:hypothetical protein
MRKILSLLAVLMLYALAYAQTRPVKGQVRDENGNVVPFATVKIKGSNAGTSADANGNFTINVKQGDVLQVSAVNFAGRDVTVGTSESVTVSLGKADGTIDEVVVTAQGIRRRPKELGYSLAKVSNEELTVGRSPQIAVDPSVKITLRGYRSMTGVNDALLVIDGLPMPPGSQTMLNLLNPNDIESITVLKGG